VHRGQIIGYIGTTGWSTGCHTHFTVMQNGVAVNPMNWL
jgi:murein DD-endopeptidase MepM/ murein hydrolase activator NlpD